MQLKEFKSTLFYNDILNPKLWDNEILDNEVRDKLLSIADEYCIFANIQKSSITDIVIGGSNANYNWGPTSDIDLHILIDPEKAIIKNEEIFKDYMINKMVLWRERHHITIKDLPVEVFAEKLTDNLVVGWGLYSLLKNEWLLKPNHESFNFDEDFILEAQLNKWINLIDSAIEKHDIPKMTDIQNSLYNLRQTSLQNEGEFGRGNLIYKELRNRGYLEKLSTINRNTIDSQLSL